MSSGASTDTLVPRARLLLGSPFWRRERLWRIFPVLDPTRWAPTPIIAAFGDGFGMALLFLLSGLFVHGGVGMGAAGMAYDLVARDGRLAERWWVWALAMLGSFTAALAVLGAVVAAQGSVSPTMAGLRAVTFVVFSAAACFAFLALFARFGHRPSAVWRSASDASYGIYLVHYAFVAWCQYALVGVALSGGVKAVIVTVVAYSVSWGTTALLRRVPVVARIV